jgi:hypothetical protein
MRHALSLLCFSCLFCFAPHLVRAGEGGEERKSAGLREALLVSTEKAVENVGRTDGFFKNKLVKILLPKELRPVEKLARGLGAGDQVDELVLGMNRAAEQAAPEANRIFGAAIRELTFEDVRRILTGGDTAATDYFRRKTTDRLAAAFAPIVERKLDEVGVHRQYQALLGQVPTLPFRKSPSLDLNRYVVGKAMDGLFLMIAQEEKQIRRNPAARVTDLLKDVFGRL